MPSWSVILALALCAPAAAAPSAAEAPAGAAPGGRLTGVVLLVADRYCPINCDPRSAQPGYAVELAERVFGPHGLKVEYRVLDWSAAVAAVQAGRATAAIAATRQEARDLVFPEAELGVARDLFVTRAGSPWRFSGLASLAGLRVGLAEGYSYDPKLEAWLAEHPGAAVRAGGEDPFATNLRSLLAGTIDLFVEDELVFNYRRERERLRGRVEWAGRAGTPEPIYLAFSPADPRSPALATLWTEEVERLRASGELAKLLRRYGLRDWR